MVATNLHDQSTPNILTRLSSEMRHIKFKPGVGFSWSPEHSVISYAALELSTQEGVWSLLHEAGHAQLEHRTYNTDFELLALEIAAWQEAKLLAKKLDVTIEEDHVQDCLDTYRDWLHRRSTCPTCGTVCLQHNSFDYQCHNCTNSWKVSSSRFCRTYRRKNIGKADTLLVETERTIVFH